MAETLKYIKKPKGRESKKARKERLENNRLYNAQKAKAKAKAEAEAQAQGASANNDNIDDNIIDETIEETPSNTDYSDQKIQDIGYSPLNEPVTKREYTIPKIDPSELQGELEEPIFTAPSLDELESMDNGASGGAEATQPKQQPRPEPTQINQAFSELPNKEKKMGAEMMADVVIDGYEKLGTGIGHLAKISETKMDREFADGNIDPNLALPINEMGDTVSVKEFVTEFNKEAEGAFETTDDFKEKVKPPLVRVFQKRGIGMTDEQLLLYYFGTDLASKGFTAVQLKKSSNAILDNLREQTSMMRGQQMPPTSTASAHHQTDEPVQQPVQATPVEETPVTEYHEPEERSGSGAQDGDNIVIVEDTSGQFAETKHAENMPEFGNKELLEDMQKLADREALKEQQKSGNKKTKS